MPHFRLLNKLGSRLSSVQSILAMEGWKGYPQFEDDRGLGRVALLACVLSTILGVNLVLCLQLFLIHVDVLPKEMMFGDWSDGMLQMAMQWTAYLIVLCTFHLGEFFTTALFNPSVTSADSYMVCLLYACGVYFFLYIRYAELIKSLSFLRWTIQRPTQLQHWWEMIECSFGRHWIGLSHTNYDSTMQRYHGLNSASDYSSFLIAAVYEYFALG